MQQMRFRRVAIIIKSTYIPLHTTGLRVLRKPSSEPGSPESEHRIGTSHDNGIKLELSIQASATHVEERTARMTDLERIRAKFAAEYGLSEDMLRNAERWTETTGDLEGVPENLLPGILGMRFGAIAIDTPRSERWSTPEDIDVIAYLPDGGYDTAAGACRGHLLDLYLPHDAVLRGGHTLPVYIDIHGGGFTYGYKELNRNFNVHLAEQGFAVFSLNYRPAPQTDLRGQLADIQAALRWIAAHMADYPVNPNAVFLTGDSAGGALTLLTLAIENNAEYENCKFDLLQTLAMDAPFTEEEFRSEKKEKLAERTFDEAMANFKRKSERLAQIANPVIKQVYENQGHMYENILIPITDGKRMYNISCNLKAAYESESKEVVKSFEKSILLHVIDEAWKENLRELDELKHSVQNASYEQKDPLLIYKLESVNLFDTMVNKINNQTVSILMRGQIPVQEAPEQAQRVEVREAAPERRQDLSKYREQKQDLNDPNQQAAAQQDTREAVKREPVRAEKTVGRNDPCPCGSGKKYKNCHGRA